jgi:hypothetical protein
MLSYMNYDLISQTQSAESEWMRMYRREDEQRLLDGIAQSCIAADVFVATTVIALLYFPEYATLVQNATLYILIAAYLAKQFGEFLVLITSHRNYVNNKSIFAIRAVNHPNPGAMYMCKLDWLNPQSVLDFRTCVVTLSLYEPPIYQTQEPTPKHPYNTRSKRRA